MASALVDSNSTGSHSSPSQGFRPLGSQHPGGNGSPESEDPVESSPALDVSELPSAPVVSNPVSPELTLPAALDEPLPVEAVVPEARGSRGGSPGHPVPMIEKVTE